MHKGYYLLGGIILFVVIGLIILYFATKSSSDSTPGTNKNKCIDNSDVPCPPNTLEYNKTYSPPKRNCNLESSSAVKIETIHNDNVNGSYIFIPEDDNYTL
jgi:hypothetical protein